MHLDDIDSAVLSALLRVKESEFATLTQSGRPISNPIFHYLPATADSIDIATGLAYPAKANRARANPKVGLLLGPAVHAHDPFAIAEAGAPETRALEVQPVIAIAARAAVRDADLQGNTDRYVECFLDEHPKIVTADWETLRQMTNYWVRIWIECRPVAVYYWPTGNLDSDAPRIWRAAEDAAYPCSDSTPVGKGQALKRWPAEPWKARAALVLPKFPRPVVTTINPEGYPVPLPTLAAELVADGFVLEMPRCCPWQVLGKACLSFGAYATFVGEVKDTRDGPLFSVQRLIGNLPGVSEKEGEQAKQLAERLSAELSIRGQKMPVIRRGASRRVRSFDARWRSAAESFRRFVPEAEPERVSRALARNLGALGSFAFEVVGEMWDRPLLSRRDRSLFVVAALAAQSRDEELALHTQVGLRHGLTRDEIEEILPHVAAYAGFPAAMAAAREIDRGLRQAEGVEKLSPRQGAAPKSDEARELEGKEVGDALGLAVTSEAHGHLGEVYKRWVLGEIWPRDALSGRDRALVTLSVVIAEGETAFLPGVASMALAAGLSVAEIEEEVTHLGLYVGIPRAMAAWDAMREKLKADSASK